MTIESIKTISNLENIGRKNYSELRVSQEYGSFKIILILGNSNLEVDSNIYSDIHSLEEFSKTINNVQFSLSDASYAVDDKGTMCDIKYMICSKKEDLLTIILDALNYLEQKLAPFKTITYEGRGDFLKFDDLKKLYPEIVRV